MSARDDRAAALVSEAIAAGRVLQTVGPDGDYTAGPYHTAVGPASFALSGVDTARAVDMLGDMNEMQTAAANALRAIYAAAKAGAALDDAKVHDLIKTVARGAAYHSADGAEGRECADKALAAFTTLGLYPAWECRYSNEDFDRTQQLAAKRKIPHDDAWTIVRNANVYH